MRNAPSVLAVGVAAALLMGLVLSFLGLQTTPDSSEYVAMARGLAAGHGALGFDGEPGGIWTPGYAMLLAVGLALGLDPVRWASVVNALLYGVLVAAVAWPAVRRLRRTAWRVALGVALIAGAPILTVATSLLADMMLLVVFAGALHAAEAVLAGRRRQQVTLGLLAAAAPLVKPLGLSIWPVALLVFFLAGSPASSARRLLRTAGFGLLVALPTLIGLARNLRLFGHPWEPFPALQRGTEEIVRRTLEEGARWWIPQIGSNDVLLVMAGLALVLTFWHRRRRGLHLPANSWVWLAGAGSLLVLLWLGSTLQPVDRPNHRLLAPVFLAGWMVLARVGDSGHGRALGSRLSTILAVAWIILTASTGARALHSHILGGTTARMGPGSEEAMDLRAWIPAAADDGLVLSNIPEFVYWHTGHHAQWTAPAVVDALQADLQDDALLVWFDRNDRPLLVQPQGLAERFLVQEIDRGRCATLYRITPRVGPGSPESKNRH